MSVVPVLRSVFVTVIEFDCPLVLSGVFIVRPSIDDTDGVVMCDSWIRRLHLQHFYVPAVL